MGWQIVWAGAYRTDFRSLSAHINAPSLQTQSRLLQKPAILRNSHFAVKMLITEVNFQNFNKIWKFTSVILF